MQIKVDMSHLEYFNVMINDSTKHRLFMIFEIGKGKTSGLLNYSWKDCLGRFILGRFYFRKSFFVAGCIYPPKSKASRGVY